MVSEEQLSIADVEGAFPEWAPDPNEPYQMFPPLPDDVYEALKESIRQHGVSQPVEVDEEGDILDGHHRFRICQELQIPCPVKVVSHLKSPQEKRDYARSVNCSRREVTTEMKKSQAEDMLREKSDRPDREISRCVGLDHKTVARIRERLEAAGDIPHNHRNIEEFSEEKEGPDLSFLEGEDWKSYHRLEALEHLKSLGDEEKQIICELMNKRQRPPKDALTMIEAAASFGEADREKLKSAWERGDEVLIICRLAGTSPAPDARLSPAIETLQTLRRIPESAGSGTAAIIAEVENLLQKYVSSIRDQQKAW